MEHYQEVMVALSESVMKNRLKRPLAEKSRYHLITATIYCACATTHISFA